MWGFVGAISKIRKKNLICSNTSSRFRASEVATMVDSPWSTARTVRHVFSRKLSSGRTFSDYPVLPGQTSRHRRSPRAYFLCIVANATAAGFGFSLSAFHRRSRRAPHSRAGPLVRSRITRWAKIFNYFDNLKLFKIFGPINILRRLRNINIELNTVLREC